MISKVHPRAGEPTPTSALVDVPKLVTAYYAERPDVSVPGQRIVFGTSGHRGSSLRSGFNEAHIVAITEAICRYRGEQKISVLFLGWDAAGADRLYTLLEREIVPRFYERAATGIPVAWVATMRRSMGRLTPRFSANRVVREYAETYYLPLAGRYRQRAADKGAAGAQVFAWRQHVGEHWQEARFGPLRGRDAGERASVHDRRRSRQSGSGPRGGRALC